MKLIPSWVGWRSGARLPAQPVSFEDLHRRLDALLRPAITFWKGVVDWDHGGFYGLVDLAGQPRPEADKDLVQQVRHLWSFSYVHRFEDGSQVIEDICRHQFEFVRDRLFIAERAQLHRSVAFDGTPRPGDIHLYQLAFGIYGLAGYALAFPHLAFGKQALEMALQVFGRAVERSYEQQHGFDERVYPGRWCHDAKEINTQLHVLEAIAELFEAARVHGHPGADQIEPILRNQLRLVALKGIATQRGNTFCSRGYERDWTVVDNQDVEYGHGIEAVHLVRMAARLLGEERSPEILRQVIALGRAVSRVAYDPVHGKWFYSGNPLTGEVLVRVSSFWTNFEALNGLAEMHDLTGEPEYLEKFERVLSWLERKQINAAVGEWYYNVDEHGRPLDRDIFNSDCGWMSFAWKSSYHSLRALIHCKRWTAWRCQLGNGHLGQQASHTS